MELFFSALQSQQSFTISPKPYKVDIWRFWIGNLPDCINPHGLISMEDIVCQWKKFPQHILVSYLIMIPCDLKNLFERIKSSCSAIKNSESSLLRHIYFQPILNILQRPIHILLPGHKQVNIRINQRIQHRLIMPALHIQRFHYLAKSV